MFGDTLVMAVRQLLVRKPWAIAGPILALTGGHGPFKEHLAGRVEIDPRLLRFRENVVGFLETQKRQGRRLVLATTAPAAIAKGVAGYLGLFDVLIASDAVRNAKAYLFGHVTPDTF